VDVVQVPVQPLAARVAGVKRRKVRKLVRRLINCILMLIGISVCDVEVFVLGSTLVAVCYDVAGQIRTSVLDLDLCITNNQG
jgi:hypothetical protein